MRRRVISAVHVTRAIGSRFSTWTNNFGPQPGLRVSVVSAKQLGNVTTADGRQFS